MAIIRPSVHLLQHCKLPFCCSLVLTSYSCPDLFVTTIAAPTKVPHFTLKQTIMHYSQTRRTTSKSISGYNRVALQALWGLSEEQACDLMHLRRLSITRRVVLSMQRKAFMAQLAASDSQVLNPTESILTVEELTKALSQNAVEDRKIFYKVARAVHRGVSKSCL